MPPTGQSGVNNNSLLEFLTGQGKTLTTLLLSEKGVPNQWGRKTYELSSNAEVT